ncbi:MAG: hypothetical protein IK016_07930 [Lachnospiraceae bacterium]|nr:hypothetical protein [Lachnospiraceae bacterium]
MNPALKKTLKHLLFAAAGALLGFVYYQTIGCNSGSCAITSGMGNTMLYGALWGYLVSLMTGGGCCCTTGSCSSSSCNIDTKDEA